MDKIESFDRSRLTPEMQGAAFDAVLAAAIALTAGSEGFKGGLTKANNIWLKEFSDAINTADAEVRGAGDLDAARAAFGRAVETMRAVNNTYAAAFGMACEMASNHWNAVFQTLDAQLLEIKRSTLN